MDPGTYGSDIHIVPFRDLDGILHLISTGSLVIYRRCQNHRIRLYRSIISKGGIISIPGKCRGIKG